MFEVDIRWWYVDKFFKVWLNDGEEYWFLVYVEVQGYLDVDFVFWMFQYYYRILDCYNKLVIVIVFYIDINWVYYVIVYQISFLGMEFIYCF